MSTKTMGATGFNHTRDYLVARLELDLAEKENRTPRFRLDDVAALVERMERSLGEEAVGLWDCLVTDRLIRAYGGTPQAEMAEVIDELAEEFGREVVDAAAANLDTRIKVHRDRATSGELRHVTLPATVEAVQTRGAPLSYQGTWKPDGDYRQGHMVTRDGVLWHCNQDTYSKPGTSPAWQMMHKNLTKAAP